MLTVIKTKNWKFCSQKIGQIFIVEIPGTSNPRSYNFWSFLILVMNQARLQTLVFNESLVTEDPYLKQMIVTKRYSNSKHLNQTDTDMNLHMGTTSVSWRFFQKY